MNELIDSLRPQLEEMLNWSNQGGTYAYLGNGKWAHDINISFNGEQMNKLFELANLVPNVIPLKGKCVDCKYSKNGKSQGYSTRECSNCKGPSNSNFEPMGV